MANFKTHLFAATTISGIASVGLVSLHLAKPWEAGSYFLLGILGGLLPDIDADRSTPLTLIFYFLAFYCAFALVFNLAAQYSYVELAMIWGAIYFGIRHLVLKIITQITVHRGAFHSLLAVVFMAMLMVNISFYILHKAAYIAWNSGLFIGIGYLVHLCLDELYSVDLNNKRMKKSFGTALKLFSQTNIGSSALMAVMLCGLIAYAPPVKHYWFAFNHAVVKYDVQKKWLPVENRWFSHLLSNISAATVSKPH